MPPMTSRTETSNRRGGRARTGRPPWTGSPPAAAALVAALAALAISPPPAPGQGSRGRGTDGADYPFVPTPPEVVAEMLEMADVTGRDTVYDLGSGDGRIVVTAARRYGSAGLGVELDSSLVAEARQRARSEGVADRVRMVRGDLFEVDLFPATVVTLYLLPRTMRKLESRLFRQLRPGARIVAHDFDMEEWAADSVLRTPGGLGGQATLYLWRVPARVGGTWELAVPGRAPLRVVVDQKYDELRVASPGTEPGPGEVRVSEARVAGDSVRFILSAGDSTGARDATRTLAGTVSGDRMEGRTGEGRWTARRVAASDTSLVAWRGGDGVETPAGEDSAGSGPGGVPRRP